MSRPEPNHEAATVAQVCSETFEHALSRVRSEKGHDVARTHDDIEPLVDTDRREIQFGEVRHQPRQAWMVLFRSGDQRRIDVDANDLVTHSCEVATDSARSTAGVEHARPTRHHGVDKTCLTAQIVTGGRHRPKPIDIPRGVARVLLRQGDPPVDRHRHRR